MKTARQIGMRNVRKSSKLWLAAFAALCACAATAATYTVSLYTAGLENADLVDVFENVVQGRANFVAGLPKFPDAPYYSLRYGSAARNRGVNAGWMASATDMAGNARINDGTVDIGCYECYLPSEGTVFFFR